MTADVWWLQMECLFWSHGSKVYDDPTTTSTTSVQVVLISQSHLADTLNPLFNAKGLAQYCVWVIQST